MSRNSDVKRVRAMFITSAACAASVAVFAIVTRINAHASHVNVNPISKAHVAAGLTCESCHAKDDARASCTPCHDNAAHASTRAGHAKLRKEGTLGCTDCHRAHDDQTITVEASGAWIRSSGATEISGHLPHGTPSATIPLVPLSACARCHDLGSRTDPVAACVSANGASACMDEHQRGDTNAHRFAAWSAATEIAKTTPWVQSKREESSPWGFLSAAFASTIAALAFTRRKRAQKKSDTPLALPAVKRLPVIDPSTCLGCHACVDACPFEVIEVQKFVAVVARPDDCCGVVLCEQACPNGSLRVADVGAVETRMVDDHLESIASPGIFLAGDLTGMPLIKNALRQGAAAIDRIAETFPKKDRITDALDVVIVGAGPAGLAASLRAKDLGLRYATLEQATLAASIQAFPRNKLVYDQPLHVPVEGDLWMRECTKEELVSQWTHVARKHALAIREQHRVVDIAREERAFVVRAQSGENEITLRASRVVIAIGRRGSPKKLPIEIAQGAESKIFYHLADARSLANQRVLVVGLGDTAMEAAIALASQPGTSVTICHRGDAFSRGKARNISEIKSLIERKKIDLRLSSEIVSVGDHVVVRTRGETSTLPIDAVFVLIGGAPSWDLLERAGVQIVSQAGS